MPKNPKIKLDVFADPKKEKKRLVAKPIIIKVVSNTKNLFVIDQ